MKWFFGLSLALSLAVGVDASAQNADPFATPDSLFTEDLEADQEGAGTATSPSASTSPYSPGYQALPDAKTLIYQHAAYRADQRRQRLAVLKWSGHSNLRPAVSQMPQYSSYSPAWLRYAALPLGWPSLQAIYR
jgi:hypothetical protein